MLCILVKIYIKLFELILYPERLTARERERESYREGGRRKRHWKGRQMGDRTGKDTLHFTIGWREKASIC
jgi:hypothetical protein